jgi:UDP-N-acetylmuramoyl-tripeptide--D-alanyl-D-alanine ligase
MHLTLEEIVRATAGRLLYGRPGQIFGSVGIDSRTIAAGALFVAIRGERHDGHDFIGQVISRGVQGLLVAESRAAGFDHADLKARGGACVVVADTLIALGALAAFHRSRFDIPVVAITGSTGKTSTRLMTTLVLSQRFATLATQGNLNNEIGLPLTLFNLSPAHQAAVVELGMNHAGEIDRLSAICRPTIGLITNVGPVHLEFFESVDAIGRAKGELIAHVLPGGVMVLNGDDAHSAALAASSPHPVLFFGTAGNATVRAENLRDTAQGVAFDLHLPTGCAAVRLQTPGRFMVANALAAAAVGHLAGLTPVQITSGLEAFTPAKGRLTLLQTRKGVGIIDDTYNANPVSMAAALETLVAVKGNGRGFIVLGDMLELGASAAALHHELGRKAAHCGAARLYAFGAHAAEVVAGARSGGMAAADVMAGEKTAIAADLTGRLQSGDWVLIKGSRGMAMETVVAAVRQWAETSNPANGG